MDNGRRATIFLVEEDDEVRPALKRDLEGAGYRVMLALDEEDARERLNGGRLRADLILVNLVGAEPDEALEAGRRIRGGAGLDVPLVVMAQACGAVAGGADVKAGGGDWITYAEDHARLEHLLARLLGRGA
jgi:DNA-binding response OmpR family regulator